MRSTFTRLPGSLGDCWRRTIRRYGLDFLAGQGQDNIDEFNKALEGEPQLHKYCSDQRPGLLSTSAKDITESLLSLLPEVDKRAMNGEGMGEEVVKSFSEAFKEGVDGWVDDDLGTQRLQTPSSSI